MLKAGEPEARVLVLLCTYNEADNVAGIIERLQQALGNVDILVVDDNSPDGTAEVVRQLIENDPRIHLMLRSAKTGLGTALRAGFLWCLERDYQFLLNLDADGSHDPATAPAMLASCQQATTDVAVGSRYVQGGGFAGLGWHRRWISRCLNVYATRVLGLPISDCSGSFRCYRTDVLKRLDFDQLTCPGYGFLEEILVALHRRGARLAEVPIQFETRLSGQSKLSLGDALGALKVIHGLAWRRG